MWDKRWSRVSLAMLFCFVLVLQFQNCGQQMDAIQGDEFLSYEELVIKHEDEDHDPDPDLIAKTETQYQPLLFDRHLVRSILANVFGPSYLNVDTAKPYYDSTEYGSPCSIYADHNVYNTTTGQYSQAEAFEACTLSSVSFLQGQMNPKSTATRQALMAKSCSDLVNNTTTLTFALTKISTQAIPDPSEENLKKLFRLFYRSHPEPHQTLIDSLKVMFPVTAVDVNHWRSAFYTVCVSSHWQVQ